MTKEKVFPPSLLIEMESTISEFDQKFFTKNWRTKDKLKQDMLSYVLKKMETAYEAHSA